MMMAAIVSLALWGQPSMANENPFGSLLKGLSKELKKIEKGGNKSAASSGTNASSQSSGGTLTKVSSGQSAQGIASNSSAAKLCFVENPGALYAKLPGADIGRVLKDFGMKKDQLLALLDSSKGSSVPYVSDLNIYNEAFDSPEISVAFEDFLKTVEPERKLELLGLMAAANNMKGFSKSTKVIQRDSMAAYGLVHAYYSNYGGNKGLGDKLILEAAKKGQLIAPYVEGLRYQYGYGYGRNLTTAAQWMRKSRKALFDQKINATTQNQRNRIIVASQILRDQVANDWFKLVLDPAYPQRDEALQQLEMQKQYEADIQKNYAQRPTSQSASYNGIRNLAIRIAKIEIEAFELLNSQQNADEVRKQLSKFQAVGTAEQNAIEGFFVVLGDSAEALARDLGKANNLDEQGKQRLASLIYQLEDLISATDKFAFGLTAMTFFQGGVGSSVAFEVGIVGKAKRITCSAWGDATKFASRVNLKMATNREIKPVNLMSDDL